VIAAKPLVTNFVKSRLKSALSNMQAEAEIYKGIVFVRVSALSADQREILSSRAFAGKIIKILKGTELVVDCLPYSFYQEWYRQTYPSVGRKELSQYPIEQSA
jgi:hypothetical protein